MTTKPLPCTDCGAPATVEALHVGADNELLSVVAACAEHADPYLADATDVVHLHPSTLPTSASGPVPALGDRVQVDGRAWEVWDVQATEAGGHEVVLFAENLDDGIHWHAPGSLATVTWQATDHTPVAQQMPGPADNAGPPTIDPTDLADLAQVFTWVPTPDEQDAIDWARAHADDLGLTGPSPREALHLVEELHQRGLDEADELAADLDQPGLAEPDLAGPELGEVADLGL